MKYCCTYILLSISQFLNLICFCYLPVGIYANYEFGYFPPGIGANMRLLSNCMSDPEYMYTCSQSS